jgi:hypothetical protein
VTGCLAQSQGNDPKSIANEFIGKTSSSFIGTCLTAGSEAYRRHRKYQETFFLQILSLGAALLGKNGQDT